MKIALLTYDHPHRKTEDVLWRLVSSGKWGEISVVATPWQDRKQRHYLYGHRPGEKNWPCLPTAEPREICSLMGMDYMVVDKGELHDYLRTNSPDVVVVGGAGILAKDVVVNFNVVNVHPGLLPARRGLDVLKWAIHDCRQVGVTAHICDEHTDLGWRLIERVVPVHQEDSFFSFAMRQYEYELDLFVPAVNMVVANLNTNNRFDKIHPGETVAHRRMPVQVEAGLMDDFDRYKKVFAR